MADAVGLNMNEVSGLIGRVEHDLTVSSEDLRLLLDLLLGSNARLNRQKSTIEKLRKLAGLVNPAEPGNRGKRIGTRQRHNLSLIHISEPTRPY